MIGRNNEIPGVANPKEGAGFSPEAMHRLSVLSGAVALVLTAPEQMQANAEAVS